MLNRQCPGRLSSRNELPRPATDCVEHEHEIRDPVRHDGAPDGAGAHQQKVVHDSRDERGEPAGMREAEECCCRHEGEQGEAPERRPQPVARGEVPGEEIPREELLDQRRHEDGADKACRQHEAVVLSGIFEEQRRIVPLEEHPDDRDSAPEKHARPSLEPPPREGIATPVEVEGDPREDHHERISALAPERRSQERDTDVNGEREQVRLRPHAGLRTRGMSAYQYRAAYPRKRIQPAFVWKTPTENSGEMYTPARSRRAMRSMFTSVLPARHMAKKTAQRPYFSLPQFVASTRRKSSVK